MHKTISCAIALLTVALSAFAQQPYWWNNPHRDDGDFMYERGMASDAPSEQDALKRAVLAAKEMLVERIGVVPALREAGISASPEFALVDCVISDSGTERKGKSWTGWVLVKYPQEEKKKILERWNASIASITELKEQEKLVPVDFALNLSTSGGRLHYQEGETVTFTVSADRDCYLVLLDHMSDGTTVLLFPNRYYPDGYVRKGQKISIPPETLENFRIVVGAPFGDDRIEAIAATQKNQLYSMFSDLVGRLGSGADMAVLSRGLFVETLGAALSGTAGSRVLWSRSELNLSTYRK